MIEVAWTERSRKAFAEMKHINHNLYGYYVHTTNLYEEARKILKINPDAEDAITITSPESFVPSPGKKNWLFTMFEGMDLPEQFIPKVAEADYLLVPSTWAGGVFRKVFKKMPIHVVHHGVRPEFTYKKRTLPRKGEKFRYLWVGAMNNRKGYEEIEFAWEQTGLYKNPNVELLYKTVNMPGLYKNKDFIQVSENITIDNRDLPIEELVKVYHSAHCFLFPSRGEGFGLTLAEAMRTGLPCVATSYSGMLDYFDSAVGYPCDYFVASAQFHFPRIQDDPLIVESRVGMCDVGDLAGWMLHIPQNYDEAIKKGKIASDRISKWFNWPNSAKQLVSVLEYEINKRREQEEKE